MEPMTKSELTGRIAHKQSLLSARDVELAVKVMLEYMTGCLAAGERIEIRGFGSFSLHFRRGRVGRNPRTAIPVALPSKYVPHFKPWLGASRARRSANPQGTRGFGRQGMTSWQTRTRPWEDKPPCAVCMSTGREVRSFRSLAGAAGPGRETPSMADARRVLGSVFGFEGFRPG